MDHEIYMVKGAYDLVITDTIDIFQCLSGYTKVVPHISDGRPIQLKLPSGSVLQPGMKLVAPGYGMPYVGFNQEKEFGDLIIELDVTFPDSLDLNLIPLLRQTLLDESGDLQPQA